MAKAGVNPCRCRREPEVGRYDVHAPQRGQQEQNECRQTTALGPHPGSGAAGGRGLAGTDPAREQREHLTGLGPAAPGLHLVERRQDLRAALCAVGGRVRTQREPVGALGKRHVASSGVPIDMRETTTDAAAARRAASASSAFPPASVRR